MGVRDWDIVTSYVDSVTTSLKIVTFPKVQEQVKVKNQGNANLTYTIGSQSGTLTSGQSVTVNEDISSFTIQAVSGTQAFELRAKEKGTEQTEIETDVVTALVDNATVSVKVESFKIQIPEVDDTARLNRAVSSLGSSGGVLDFKMFGSYTISSRIVLPNNCTILGNFAKIKLKDNTPTANNPDLFLIKNISNIRIFNLELDGNNTNQGQLDSNVYRGILIQNASDILIENCYFHDTQHQAIQVTGATPGNSTTKGVYNITVNKCKFYNTWSALQITESDSQNVLFEDNYVENTWEHGFTTYPGCSFINVSDNTFKNVGLRDTPTYSTYNAGCGIRIFETFNAIVEGNTIINPNFCGIRITTNSPTFYQTCEIVIVSENIIRGGSRNGNKGSGINIGEQGNANNVVVKGNIIENFINYTFGDGITVKGNNCVIDGNRIIGTKQAGIDIQGNFNTITDNNITDSGLYGIAVGGANPSDNTLIANNTIQTVNQSTPISRGIYTQANATNVKLSNNIYSGIVTNVFNGGSAPLFINGVYESTAIPTVGTYIKGEIVKNPSPVVGSSKGWRLTGSGTQGTLNGGATTGSITTGTTTLNVNSTTGLAVNNYISIAGVSGAKKVLVISGTTVTIDIVADVTVSNAAVGFINAAFASEGNL
jgi:hypothetical protein